MPSKQQYLRECFDYNPKTGKLYWKERPREHFHYKEAWKKWNEKYSAKQAFPQKDLHGWHFGWLDHRCVYAHHIIFALMTGIEAKKVHHLDGNRTNNRAKNLSNINPGEPKIEYALVYNCALKNWNVQRNVYSTHRNSRTTQLLAEFATKAEAINYKNNRENAENGANY